MRALTMMLSGLLMVGLTGAAEAKKGKDDKEHAIAECGKHTKVARPDDGIITLKEKKNEVASSTSRISIRRSRQSAWTPSNARPRRFPARRRKENCRIT